MNGTSESVNFRQLYVCTNRLVHLTLVYFCEDGSPYLYQIKKSLLTNQIAAELDAEICCHSACCIESYINRTAETHKTNRSQDRDFHFYREWSFWFTATVIILIWLSVLKSFCRLYKKGSLLNALRKSTAQPHNGSLVSPDGTIQPVVHYSHHNPVKNKKTTSNEPSLSSRCETPNQGSGPRTFVQLRALELLSIDVDGTEEKILKDDWVAHPGKDQGLGEAISTDKKREQKMANIPEDQISADDEMSRDCDSGIAIISSAAATPAPSMRDDTPGFGSPLKRIDTVLYMGGPNSGNATGHKSQETDQVWTPLPGSLEEQHWPASSPMDTDEAATNSLGHWSDPLSFEMGTSNPKESYDTSNPHWPQSTVVGARQSLPPVKGCAFGIPPGAPVSARHAIDPWTVNSFGANTNGPPRTTFDGRHANFLPPNYQADNRSSGIVTTRDDWPPSSDGSSCSNWMSRKPPEVDGSASDSETDSFNENRLDGGGPSELFGRGLYDYATRDVGRSKNKLVLPPVENMRLSDEKNKENGLNAAARENGRRHSKPTMARLISRPLSPPYKATFKVPEVWTNQFSMDQLYRYTSLESVIYPPGYMPG